MNVYMRYLYVLLKAITSYGIRIFVANSPRGKDSKGNREIGIKYFMIDQELMGSIFMKQNLDSI